MPRSGPELNRLLKRQLRRLKIDPSQPPQDPALWQALLERVGLAYEQADQDRYTLERSLDVSSREMQALYEALQASSESRLAEERDRLNAVITALGDGLCLLGPDNKVLLANPETANLLGGGLASIVGADFYQLTGLAGHGERVRSAIANRRAYRAEEAQCRRLSGSNIPVSYVVNPVLREDSLLGSVVVFRDITQQKQVEKTLREARDSANEASRAKSEFLSRMSHELRTPMNAILGFAQLLELEDDPPLSTDQRDSVAHILKGGHHLLELINEVLDLAKIESGRLQVSLEDINVTELLRECVTLISPLAEERGIQLDTRNVEGMELYVRADYIRLKQVFINLLSNAVKYNRDNGEVHLLWRRAETGRIGIGIRDTGYGLKQDQLAAIFEPFNRLGNSDTVEGTGIGLTITRRLVELMQGQVHADSEPNAGSTFWVELDETQSSAQSLSRQASEAFTEAGYRASVLYVEDNPANLQLVKIILKRRSGIRLLSTDRAETGIDLARAQRPDLILLDINLPGMDGFEALRRFKSLPDMQDMPIIALSANALPRDIKRGLEAGFDHYLTKPINIQDFLTTLDEILAVPPTV